MVRKSTAVVFRSRRPRKAGRVVAAHVGAEASVAAVAVVVTVVAAAASVAGS
jgi:hypothetical protein